MIYVNVDPEKGWVSEACGPIVIGQGALPRASHDHRDRTIEDLCRAIELLLGRHGVNLTAAHCPEWDIAIGSLGRARGWGKGHQGAPTAANLSQGGVATPQTAEKATAAEVRVGQVYRSRETGCSYTVVSPEPAITRLDTGSRGWLCAPNGGPFLGYEDLVVYDLDNAARYELVTGAVGG